MKNKMFQPGAILHEVIVGAFRAKGTSFDAWCTQNGVNRSTARLATYGQSGGERGKELLKAMIEDAGVTVVEAAYRKRMIMEAEKLQGAAA
ncbi:MAG: hypothetical protein CSA73_00565 [Rhodobacterales bacterium]|nr:MAG: hypothetical protein CR958_00515 [Rhodobacterales bacterium]PIE09053.1 MAG: hypothetical protein CSA73_00565 [Rhodobacterales bacterium]